MFAFHSPPVKKALESANTDSQKSPELTMKAGPSNEPTQVSKVRQSIGEWESGKPDRSPTTPKKAEPAPAGLLKTKTKPKTTLSQESKVTRKTSVEAAGSSPKPEKPKYADRTAEARTCLTKVKMQLGSARNLRTDIKTEVTIAAERLYQLVKEAEKGKAKHGKGEDKDLEEEREEEPRILPPSLEPRREEMDLIRKLEEHSQLIKESNERIEGLKEVMEKQQMTLEEATYARVAAGPTGKQFPGQTALHSVVVTSKDEKETGEEVLNRIRGVINAKEGWVTVDRVRKAKDRKVIVGCKTEEERQKVKERLRMAEDHLNVEEVKNKDPLLLLRDVFQYNSDEDVLSALRNQNRSVFRNLEKQDYKMEIRYRKKTRNPQTCHIIIRVSPKIWLRAMEAGSVHVDLQRVRVVDQSPLVQCSLCLGYGHGRRFCKQTVEKCSHCGGPHMRSECADWLAGVVPKCCNCTHAKLDLTDHNAFSQECPVRQKWDALARATIAYC